MVAGRTLWVTTKGSTDTSAMKRKKILIFAVKVAGKDHPRLCLLLMLVVEIDRCPKDTTCPICDVKLSIQFKNNSLSYRYPMRFSKRTPPCAMSLFWRFLGAAPASFLPFSNNKPEMIPVQVVSSSRITRLQSALHKRCTLAYNILQSFTLPIAICSTEYDRKYGLHGSQQA
jgi:hypothetical protein